MRMEVRLFRDASNGGGPRNREVTDVTHDAEATDPLPVLAQLLRRRAAIDVEIADVIRRPTYLGHIGEFIASRIFDIELHPNAAHPGSDGVFRSGPLAGKSVNVKYISMRDGCLDVPVIAAPDYLLVLAGSVRGKDAGVARFIESVYVFPYRALVDAGVVPGIAASVRKAHWNAARVYPTSASTAFVLEDRQRSWLALFGGEESPASPAASSDGSAAGKMRFACCFCARSIDDGQLVFLALSLPADTHAHQGLYAHSTCLSERLHPSVPFDPTCFD